MKKKINLLILIFFIAGFFVQAKPVQASAAAVQFKPARAFTQTPCMFTVPEGYVDGQDVICGYVTVPELHADPEGNQIQLAVAIIRTTDQNPQSDPIFMMQGGPGGSSIDTFSQLLLGATATLHPNRDMVLFDQRGTLYSRPSLVCDEIYQMTIRNLDVVLTPKENEDQSMEALAACRSRLTKEGVNLSAYNSLENAADVEDVRIALGYDEINLYGVSYGTLLALHTMASFPRHLRSVTLDSVVPPESNFILDSPKSEDRSFSVFFNSCTADADCNRTYPNLEKTFFSLVEKYNKEPAKITLTNPDTQQKVPARLSGDDLQGMLFQLLYSTEIIPLLPRMIANIQHGDLSLLERFESMVVFDKTMSYGMYYSVVCAEETSFSSTDFNLSGVRPEIAESEGDTAKDLQQTCQLWNVTSLASQADQPVVSDIPTLVLSGEYDPITPPAYADQVAVNLSHSYRVNFPTGGHGAVTSGDCQNQVFIDFLNNPSNAPDTTCISANAAVDYLSPKNTLILPIIIPLLNLETEAMIGFALVGLSILICCISMLVYIIAWLVKKNRRQIGPELPFSQQILPWLVFLIAAVLTSFIIGLVFVGLKMAIDNDLIMLIGMPKSWSLLFVLPLLVLALTIALVICVIKSWQGKHRSVLRRVYDSLVALSVLVAVVVLANWGMLTVLIFNS
jgi:pimeloyl-ACP methyl ester carboxylesterase